jgi:hypothetical protein
MTEQTALTTYLPDMECQVSPGLMDWEVIATVEDEKGRKQNVSVSKGMVTRVGDKNFLGVGIIEVDYRGRRVLVELPNEADSGVWRLWAPFTAFRKGT